MLKIKDRVYLEAKKGTFTEAFKRTNDSKSKKQNYFELQDIVHMIGMLECC